MSAVRWRGVPVELGGGKLPGVVYVDDECPISDRPIVVRIEQNLTVAEAKDLMHGLMRAIRDAMNWKIEEMEMDQAQPRLSALWSPGPRVTAGFIDQEDE